MIYDAIVVGCGGVGSAVLHQLASRGMRALGIDRFPPGHDRGSSHGGTRAIRRAYFEHPDYVPLLERAYALWSELEMRVSTPLIQEVGLLQIGPRSGTVLPGVERSAREHGLLVERLPADEVRHRFPGLVVPEGAACVFEPGAGILRAEDAVRAHAREAQRLGASLETGGAVVGWRDGAAGVRVEAGAREYRARRLVVAPGAWARGLLADLRIPLRVLRKHVYWYGCSDARYRQEEGCPLFLYETDRGSFYGFPSQGGSGLKVAEHTGGEPIGDPLRVARAAHPEDRRRVADFLEHHLEGRAGLTAEPIRHSACMYTMTPDGHFLVGRHPGHDSVLVAAGFSGHGFKFAPVLGEVVAALAAGEAPDLPCGFLGPERFGDPETGRAADRRAAEAARGTSDRSR